MLLTIDLGNSNLKAGLFDMNSGALTAHFQIASPYTQSIQELQKTFQAKFKSQKESQLITHSICASVVPPLESKVRAAIHEAFGCECQFLTLQMALSQLHFEYPKPEELGKDRLSNAIAVKLLYKTPAIIIDSGTTTTFCVLGARGQYLGGLISPGITTSTEALTKSTAQLPEIDIHTITPSTHINTSTIAAMHAGVFYSLAYSIERIAQEIKAESEQNRNSIVVLTGGNAKLLSQRIHNIDILDSHLTLKGLKILYMQKIKNKKTLLP